MTITPGSAELLALADRIKKHSLGWIKQVDGEVSGCSELDACLLEEEETAIIAALRLAAKPAEEGVREATIEKCARLVETFPLIAVQTSSFRYRFAEAIRALSTPGQPKL